MNKRGAMQMRREADAECYQRAVDYLSKLPDMPVHQIVKIPSPIGKVYGVIVNIGDKITVWNARNMKLEKYGQVLIEPMGV